MPKSSFSIVCRSAWHSSFLALLPQIHNYVLPAFRHLREAERDDAIQNAIAHAFVMFVRLMKRSRADLVYPTVLARFGIGHAREGRSFGTPVNSRDVTSRSAQLRRGFPVAQLDRYDCKTRRWLEAVVEDHRTAVADQVAFRIDFPEWLSRLSARNCRIAESLAYGNSTNSVARQFRVSAARIAQIRHELHDSWERFHEGPALVGARCPDKDYRSGRSRHFCQRTPRGSVASPIGSRPPCCRAIGCHARLVGSCRPDRRSTSLGVAVLQGSYSATATQRPQADPEGLLET
jgi:hypothetical protein